MNAESDKPEVSPTTPVPPPRVDPSAPAAARPGAAAKDRQPKGSDRYTVGQWVALLLGGGASWLWLRRGPSDVLTGAGGAIFPVLVVITILYFAVAWLGPLLDENLLDRGNARKLRARRFGWPFLRDVARARDRAQRKLSVDALGALDRGMDALQDALEAEDPAAMEERLAELERTSDEVLHRKRKGILRDFAESIGGALAIALLLRMFVLEAFKIPSGSMIPTLEIGDHIFVNKFVYGVSIPFTNPPRKLFTWRAPQPGDVIVFIAPEPATNAGEDFIKRVVAVAGQKVKLKDGVLHVDGNPYPREGGQPLQYEDGADWGGSMVRRTAAHYVEDTAGVKHSVLYQDFGEHDFPTGLDYSPVVKGVKCNAEECEILPGYVFCMGDNRDNSQDSRKWGAVPLQSIKGRAMFIWMSVRPAETRDGFPSIRWKRIGTGIN
ncbi:MAG: signal peptidase I [Deltaproteobacteria bacterium]|nr:signal peptidase I [Deltaproteobacteria bacterium]